MTKSANFGDPQMFLMRHAESVEDIDNAVYERVPDHAIDLTVEGRSQAMKAASEITGRIGVSRSLSIFCSPARRAAETAEIIAARIRSTTTRAVHVQCRADGRLAKQDWGSVTVATREQHMRKRYEAGAMNYRFPDGESGWDVAIRMRSLIGELTAWSTVSPSDSAVMITHGFTVRVALMILLDWTEAELEQYANPPNCFLAEVRARDNAMMLIGEGPPLYAPGPAHIPRVR
jgi:broad specificity phosphatase PhoE